MESFDVVVVGGRCAGAALAIYAARAGLRVCLVDKAKFPSETPSTHVIQPRGVEILSDLGVLEAVLAAGAALLERFTLVNDDVRIDGTLADFALPGLNVRRIVLDGILLDAAAHAGVDVRTACRVTGVRTAGDRVCGVETVVGTIDGELVVGADGRRSIIAESVGAREYLVKPPGRMPIWGYFAAGPRDSRLRLAHIGEYGFLASPTDAGLYMVVVGVGAADVYEFNRNREANFRKALGFWPEVADFIGDAPSEGPLRVMANWHSYFRESAGPGWVLVGDAGHFKDFTPAQGIADALVHARSLAAVVAATVDSTTDQDHATQRWWRERDRASYDMYWLSMQMGRPGSPSPLTTELLRRLARDPSGATTMLRVLNRDMPSSAMFTPSRLLAAIYLALRDHPDERRRTLADVRTESAVQIERLAARCIPQSMYR